jgi:hypothetical protein
MLYWRLKSDNCLLLITPRISWKASPSMLREGGPKGARKELEGKYGNWKDTYQPDFPNLRVVIAAQPVWSYLEEL